MPISLCLCRLKPKNQVPITHCLLYVRNGNANNRSKRLDMQQIGGISLNDQSARNQREITEEMYQKGFRFYSSKAERTEV